MARIHTLGFPRIGADRELKRAVEAHWKGELSLEALEDEGRALRRRHGAWQAGFDLVPVGDFSFYDHVADLSLTLGVVPPRHRTGATPVETLFRMARGAEGAPACEMTKWLNTNYHYLVPEFDRSTSFRVNADRWVEVVREARGAGLTPKPVLVGPLTYLALGQVRDGLDRLSMLPSLVDAYVDLLTQLAAEGVTWVQLDEPWLGTELELGWDQAYRRAYRRLAEAPVSILVATYFGRLGENRELALGLPVAGIHLDAVTSPEEAYGLADRWPDDKVLSLGVVNGRNVWITDLGATLERLQPLHARLGDRLWVAPSCSLLHVPVDLASETRLDPNLRSTLAFARQKLDEVRVLGQALNQGREAVAEALEANARAVAGRTRAGAAAVVPGAPRPRAPYALREALQRERLDLPRFPTTTIGSFPQTAEVRQVRRRFKDGLVTEAAYREALRKEIARTVRAQEELGLDVLVHGEAERNDMVEYFGEQLEGYAFTDFGWVQSYGSRCVKPPLLFGDLSRRRPMTVEWIAYAQSLTAKPVKGMLTGPVTMLNWSFVRDDQPRETTCRQLAVVLRDEVLDLERAGVAIIQIDEAALREGLPLRRSDRVAALAWAVECFHLMANEVADQTQIHTHMCYSEFNEILPAIAALDADVLTVESARSAERLLAGLGRFAYPNALGPGVYDIHSPQVPTVEEIEARMVRAAQVVPADRLWVNPDCGLKTRTWAEVTPALASLVEAARRLRRVENGL